MWQQQQPGRFRLGFLCMLTSGLPSFFRFPHFLRSISRALCRSHARVHAGGTAGQPILGGIESEGLSEVMVVVTRYSGGIKLGTGGLCRAYGGASRLCLQAAER